MTFDLCPRKLCENLLKSYVANFVLITNLIYEAISLPKHTVKHSQSAKLTTRLFTNKCNPGAPLTKRTVVKLDIEIENLVDPNRHNFSHILYLKWRANTSVCRHTYRLFIACLIRRYSSIRSAERRPLSHSVDSDRTRCKYTTRWHGRVVLKQFGGKCWNRYFK